MPYSAAQAAYKLAYEIAPISLSGGVANSIPGGMLPILSLLDSLSFSQGLLGSSDLGLDDTFANFFPLPGTSLVDNQIGNYPFANMAVAANAIIAQPLVVSLMMRCPVHSPNGYALKSSIMSALQSTLAQHNRQGGTYTVATPSMFFTNCILIGLHDASGGESLQAQMQWRWDFVKPLVTLQDAISTQNAQMSKLSSGTATQGDSVGLGQTVGAPQTVALPGVSPAAQGSAASGISVIGNINTNVG